MDKNSIDILNFWFKEIKPKQWFDKNSNFDNLIYSKFYDLHYRAINGELNYWKNTLKESLAFIILIDQFSRNMFRENRLSFDYDYLALEFCNYGLMNKYLEEFNNFDEKLFFIMPLIHHEDFNSQTKALNLLDNDLNKHPNYKTIHKFFYRHLEIIKIFGRFPHRNKILKRSSTKEELDFLKTPFSSF